MYGVCMDNDGKTFDYLIADDYAPGREIPPGCVLRDFPADTWAVFPCRGALPQALQSVNTKIWSEWLPACKAYKLAGNCNIEHYTPMHENQAEDYNEIWLPVEKV